MEKSYEERSRPDPDSGSSSWLLMLLALAGAITGLMGFWLFARRAPVPPPSPAVAANPRLTQGQNVYQAKCLSCHGIAGHADGPIAKNLPAPKPRDFAATTWRHGDRPEQVRAVIADGVKDTAMAAWRGTLTAAEIDAVTEYTLFLGGRDAKTTADAPGTPVAGP